MSQILPPFQMYLLLLLLLFSIHVIKFFQLIRTHFSTGSSLSDKVYQTPADMFKNPGETAKIQCLHRIQGYNRILWYKKSNRQLQFLGYMFSVNGNPENGLNVKMEGSANEDKTCTLINEGLSLNSSAVYYCAASVHSAKYHCSSVQKPLTFFFISLCDSLKPVTPPFLLGGGGVSLLRPLYFVTVHLPPYLHIISIIPNMTLSI